jgi:IS30 family transposase
MLFAFRSQGQPVVEIARRLGRHPSTVYRELRRNFGLANRFHYSPSDAHRTYQLRLAKARRREPLKCAQIRKYVKKKLRARWSPEIIAGRLPLDHPGLTTNHDSIYLYIYRRRRTWAQWLTHGHKRRRRRLKRPSRLTKWASRPSIELRDPVVDDRKQAGHWEVDTVVSQASPAALAVAYERTTRLVRLRLLTRKTAANFHRAISRALIVFPGTFRRTITYDNGSENTQHERTNTSLSTRSYFCHPYTSWEKPGVEQCIGLLRAFIPKGTDIAKLSQYQLRYYQDLLNNRPRKCLGFKTPNEAYRDLALPD